MKPKKPLISPYGGILVNLMCSSKAEQEFLLRKAQRSPSVQLSLRSLQDLELMATGAFSPLDRFMSEPDYHHVLDDMRLGNGTLFPIPITLPLRDRTVASVGKELTLRNLNNEIVAIMMVEEIYEREYKKEATCVFGTVDTIHPLVSEMDMWGNFYISGPLKVLQVPAHYDFTELRCTPLEMRSKLEAFGFSDIVAFQTRNPMHRVHEELTKRAVEKVRGALLIHPTVGITKNDDVDAHTRVGTYEVMYKNYYDSSRTLLYVLPLAMRFAGPREAVWHAIIRRNYGANYFIVGRDHASPGSDAGGKPFYDPYAAQVLLSSVKDDIGVHPIFLEELVYIPDKKRYVELSQVDKDQQFYSLSGTKVRKMYLEKGRRLPLWFTRRPVARLLAERYVPRHKKGFCVWFTGLPGSGKSTTAMFLSVLLQQSGRTVTLLDGDVVRTHLSQGLGYSKTDRDTNVRRIGFVASEVVKHNGIAVCAAISPYESTRNYVRHLMPEGAFMLIHMDTPLDICRQRDPKGMYQKAREGKIAHFTGVNDVYEPPVHVDLRLHTVNCSPSDTAEKIMALLRQREFIR